MNTKVKKSFTLVELLIVIVLISTTYFLVFSSNNFSVKSKNEYINLDNLKEYLLKNFQFNKKLLFFCIEDDYTCYIKADGVLNKGFEIKNFFSIAPLVYEYAKEEKTIVYDTIQIDSMNYDVIFKYEINSDYKTNEFILDTQEDRVYVFNSIYEKPKFYKSLNQAFETFNTNEIEVRDAF